MTKTDLEFITISAEIIKFKSQFVYNLHSILVRINGERFRNAIVYNLKTYFLIDRDLFYCAN